MGIYEIFKNKTNSVKYNFHFIEKNQFDPQIPIFAFIYLPQLSVCVVYKIVHVMTSIAQYNSIFFLPFLSYFSGVIQQNANARATRKPMTATHTEETWIIQSLLCQIINVEMYDQLRAYTKSHFFFWFFLFLENFYSSFWKCITWNTRN